ncbi:MAG: DUF1571 domain-containing protein [Burkholderiales bacterium]|nr:DUF1571 domain-containing protein [Bacteroidia bacterium]
MNKIVLIIITIALCSTKVFSQRSKKNAKLHGTESPKEVSHEHFKDFKLISDMLDSAKKFSFLRYSMKSVERTESGYATAQTNVKLQVHPRRSYLVNTQNKLEVLYNEGEMSNKALVKPHVFPYFTMSLDPRGNLMRKNQHFTILDIGFDFTARTIAVALSKEKEHIAKHLTYVGKVEKNKMNCHLLVYENLEFGYRDYIVQQKETVTSIAGKLTVNDYMLRCKNKLYDDYGYLKEGSVIKTPTFYCKKAVFYIDEKTMLPISVSIYDETGLFESYDFSNLEINKPIPANEFSRNFKGYGF